MNAHNLSFCSLMEKVTPKKALYLSPDMNLQKKVKPPPPKLCIENLQINENVPYNTARPTIPKTSQRSNPRFSRGPLSARQYPQISPVIPNAPITPKETKERYAALLTSYEMKEIDDFDEIYYLGTMKKHRPRSFPGNDNYGYDDNNHHYKTIVGDHLAYRFEIRAVFGKGAFGQVVRCFDHKLKRQLALKIVINTAQMHEQGRIEVAILQHLNGLDQEMKIPIVRNYDSFVFRGHVCATFEIMGLNLYEYSRSIRFQPCTQRQIHSLAKNMLLGLQFIHSNNVIHCDMKPENVLLKAGSTMNCSIIDFGSSCFKGRQKYEYIQSRFYRAPEVILGIPYGPPIDIWSFGCIIVEMMIGRPIWPGEDEHEQLELIMEVLGIPPKSLILKGKRRREFFDGDGKPIVKNGKRRRIRIPGGVSLKNATRISDPIFLDFIQKCFEWEPEKRITAEEALKHPWFSVVKTVERRRSSSVRSSLKLPGIYQK